MRRDDIDDGLRRETRNGCAAAMVDGLEELTDRPANELALPCEEPWPAFVVWYNPDLESRQTRPRIVEFAHADYDAEAYPGRGRNAHESLVSVNTPSAPLRLCTPTGRHSRWPCPRLAASASSGPESRPARPPRRVVEPRTSESTIALSRREQEGPREEQRDRHRAARRNAGRRALARGAPRWDVRERGRGEPHEREEREREDDVRWAHPRMRARPGGDRKRSSGNPGRRARRRPSARGFLIGGAPVRRAGWFWIHGSSLSDLG